MNEGCLEIVAGEMRSGKSEFAENLVLGIDSQRPPLYLATLPNISLFAERIQRHINRRCPSWEVIEVGHSLLNTLSDYRDLKGRVLILEGLLAYLVRSGARFGTGPGRCLATGSDLVFEVVDFLSCAAQNAVMVVVVTTLCQKAVLEGSRPAQIDLVGMRQNIAICDHLSRLPSAGIPWHITQAKHERRGWWEIVTSFGWTTP